MQKLKIWPAVLVVLVAFSLFFVSFEAAAYDKGYVISYSPGTVFHDLVRDRIKVVYERAGIEAEFVALPHNRSLISANSGVVDGDAGRVPSVEEKYTNLRRVNVKLMDLNGAVYTARKDIKAYEENMLTDYRVGHVLGVQWAQKKMRGFEATTANSYKALFDMLVQKRIDLILGTEASAEAAVEELGERASDIRKLQPFVFSAPIYHYVHKKNEEIIPRLEKALTELLEEGYWSQ